MGQEEIFRPSSGDIILKGNLSHGLGESCDVFKKNTSRPSTQSSGRFGRLSHNSFFARHNPHPARVRHLKGLLDIPICSVNDDIGVANPRYSSQWPPNNHDQAKLSHYSRYYNIPANAINVNTQMHPINTITGLQYFLGKPMNFRITSERIKPRSGIGSVEDVWRSELQVFTEALGLVQPKDQKLNKMEQRKTPMTGGRPKTQYSETTGRIIPPPSRAMSRGFSRASQRRDQCMTMAEQLNIETPNAEDMVMTLLCQILQTEDINAVQQWLVAAGDREKNLVMDLLRSALTSKEEYYKQPQEIKDYIEEREKDRPVSGILGDESDPLKKIDRLTLDPSSPRPMTAPTTPLLPPIGVTDEQVQPPTSSAFRPATGASQRSARPSSRLATPQSPAVFKYTSKNEVEPGTWNQDESTVNN